MGVPTRPQEVGGKGTGTMYGYGVTACDLLVYSTYGGPNTFTGSRGERNWDHVW